MRRNQRHSPTFSVSALDLFASALGTFVLLTIFLFPYYINEEKRQTKQEELITDLTDSQQNLIECQQQKNEQQSEQQQLLLQLQTALSEAVKPVIAAPLPVDTGKLQSCQRQQVQQSKKLQRCQRQKQQCQRQLANTFLTLVLKWKTERQDIDLHVKDPNGNTFFYKKHNRNQVHFNSVAELSVDSVQGPGIEIWEHPQAIAGRYQVFANLYDRVGNIANPKVSTTLYYRGGSYKLPTVQLIQEEKKYLIATVIVSKTGKVTIK